MKRSNQQDQRSESRSDRQDNVGDRQEDRQDFARETQEDRQDFYEDNRYGWGWGHGYGAGGAFMAGMILGAAVVALPRAYTTVYVSGAPYYYSNGVYYQNAPSGQGYTVVEAPAGAEVQQLPEQTINVNVEGDTYQYANGAYYQEKKPEKQGEDPSYEVVDPPKGATVQNIPEDAKKEKVGDKDYFVYGNTWYKPFSSGSDVVYMVVPKPDGAKA